MKFITFALVLLFIAAAFFLVWNYLLEIYEVNYESEFIDKDEPGLQIKIRALPVNGLGREITLRSVAAQYSFDDSSKIRIIKEDTEKGIIIFETSEGKIPEIYAESEFQIGKAIISVNSDTLNN